MIFKDLDAIDWHDQSAIARHTAQEQMPYYLRRYFGDSTEVDVLNQLRVSTGGITTQLDHLLLHPYGMVVVDSTSVSGRLQVKEDGRWLCLHRKSPTWIRSPVTLAYAQALSLKAFLDKKVRQKGFFDRIELDVLVAVPDIEAIEWPAAGAMVEVCNADEVPRRVNACVAQYRATGVGPGLLVPAQRLRLAEFLCVKHQPVRWRRP